MTQTSYIAPEPTRSVLLTIDMQRDFSVPGAPAYVDDTKAAVSPLQQVLDAFRTYDRPIVHVVRLYRPDGSNVDACRRQSIEKGEQIVAPGTEGAELVDALKPTPSATLDAETLLSGTFQLLAEREWAMYKPRWGAFFQTPLEEFLEERALNTVVVAGCNFPNCPRTTIYEASERDFRIGMIPEAVSGTYDRGLQELENIGVRLMTKAECENWLAGKEEAPVTAALN